MSEEKTIEQKQKDRELLNRLKPVIDIATQMILAGTLKKNVVRHFKNRGFTAPTAENIMELGVFNAEQFMKWKAK